MAFFDACEYFAAFPEKICPFLKTIVAGFGKHLHLNTGCAIMC